VSQGGNHTNGPLPYQSGRLTPPSRRRFGSSLPGLATNLRRRHPLADGLFNTLLGRIGVGALAVQCDPPGGRDDQPIRNEQVCGQLENFAIRSHTVEPRAERLDRVASELGELVEEKYAAMTDETRSARRPLRGGWASLFGVGTGSSEVGDERHDHGGQDFSSSGGQDEATRTNKAGVVILPIVWLAAIGAILIGV
jgi:hypothetical protein